MKSKKYTDAAKGQPCTLNIVGVCNYDPETTVFCHFPDETNGMGKKSDDISGGDACSNCHDMIDGRVKRSHEYGQHQDWYYRRSQTRTLRNRIERGIVKL